MIIVTGPSFTSSTCMLAPNTPVRASLPSFSLNVRANSSYSGTDTVGGAASVVRGVLADIDVMQVLCSHYPSVYIAWMQAVELR